MSQDRPDHVGAVHAVTGGDAGEPARGAAFDTPSPDPITSPYLLALDVPVVLRGGVHHASASWAKDLLAHTAYLSDLTLLCPLEPDTGQADLQPVERSGLRFVTFPPARGFGAALRGLGRLIRLVWRETGRAAVVHTGLAGWPIPIGWAASLAARIRGKPLVIVVESAFWRIADEHRVSWRRRLAAWARERINRWCVAQADYAAYTQPAYRESLPPGRARIAAIELASWVDESDLLPRGHAEGAWVAKRGETPRLLFASRFVPDKGMLVLLDSITELRRRAIAAEIVFLGSAPPVPLLDAAAEERGPLRVRVADPVPYGPAFFDLLDGFHAVLVPSLSDEQPRIVLDAAARAIPSVASDTDGLRACVAADETGLLVPAGNPIALADAIERLVQRPDRGAALGLAALERVRATTHRQMHARRARRIAELLATR